MHEIILRNGRIIDGTGNPWYKGDIAVKEGRISSIGKINFVAERNIDVNGLVVCPGFIDTHSHSDLIIISEPDARQKIMQGITTEIIGQDGLGEAPIRDDVLNEWRRYLSGLNGDPEISWDWRSFGEYLNRIERASPATNVVALVGHGNLRLLTMGMENRKPTLSELGDMKELLTQSLSEGGHGLSTGLIYPPCEYAATEEIIDLCKVVAMHDGIFVVHMRNEGDRLLESINEVMRIGNGAKIRVHISHFKASGEENWGKSQEALNLLDFNREKGIDASFDQYPYTAGSTFLSSLLPTWAHEGGTTNMLSRLKDKDIRSKIKKEIKSEGTGERCPPWNKILITSVKTGKNEELEGKTMEEISNLWNKDPIEVLLDLILVEDNAVTMVTFTQSEKDVRRIMKHQLQTVCTDGIVLGKPHPRAYGSFPRVLGRYVREGVQRLEETIRKMTSWPAGRFRLNDMGILRPGFRADITVFDHQKIKDMATYENPKSYPKGIKYVIVNGKMAMEKGKNTGRRSGRVIR
jgi:N-acyl-D-amino-acid deacylase